MMFFLRKLCHGHVLLQHCHLSRLQVDLLRSESRLRLYQIPSPPTYDTDQQYPCLRMIRKVCLSTAFQASIVPTVNCTTGLFRKLFIFNDNSSILQRTPTLGAPRREYLRISVYRQLRFRGTVEFSQLSGTHSSQGEDS